MQVIVERCCGLDVHQETVVACLLIGLAGARPSKEVRTFGTMTRDLEALCGWLKAAGVTHVGMESTGVYWRPVYAVLEGHFDLIVGNARHIRNVPGGKTDVKDAEWIADLVRHGLITKSFVPPAPLRDLRELLRYRRKLMESQAAERNRLLKLLETANIKLASVASDVFGVSGRAMLKALIEGNASAQEMAALAKGQLRRKRAELVLALDGKMKEHHRFLLAMQLRRLEAAEQDVAALDLRIAERLEPYRAQHALLMQIPGVDWVVAAVPIAEIGVDMACSSAPTIWPPGPAYAPATTRAQASRRVGVLAKAMSTSAPCWSAQPSPPDTPRGAISRTNTIASRRAAAPCAQPSRSPTRYSSPPITCSPRGWHIAISETPISTRSASAEPSPTSSAVSNASATTSPSNERPRSCDCPPLTAYFHGRDSLIDQRTAVSLGVQGGHSGVNGSVEIVGVSEGLMGEMMSFEIAPDGLDVVEFGSVFGQPLDGEPMGAGGKRGGGGLAHVDRPVVEHDDDRLDRQAGPRAVKAVEPLQESNEIGAALGFAGVHDEVASGVIERSHHRDLLGLAGRRHPQVGATLGPGSGEIGMRQRLALVGEEKHDVAGLRLRLAQRQPEADAIDGVGVLAALQGVARPTPAEFFFRSTLDRRDLEMVTPSRASISPMRRASVQLRRSATGASSNGAATLRAASALIGAGPGAGLVSSASTPARAKSLRHRRTVSSRTPNASAMRGLVQPDSVSNKARARSASPRSRDAASLRNPAFCSALAATGDLPAMSHPSRINANTESQPASVG